MDSQKNGKIMPKAKDRRIARGYPVTDLWAYDMDDPSVEGCVLDLSEKGVQIAGMPLQVNEVKTLIIQTDPGWDIKPFSFDAECRWYTSESEEKSSLAGLEIMAIEPGDLEELQKTIARLVIMENLEPS